MHNKGRLIVVEGLEGAGKTTAMSYIKHFLSTSISNLVVTREPGGTEEGEKIRTLLKSPEGKGWLPKAQLLLLYAARLEHVERVIKPALKDGKWVIRDMKLMHTEKE